MNESNQVTVTLEIDEEILAEAEKVFAAQGYTLEEATVLFFRWCISNPDEAKATIKSWLAEEQQTSL